MIILLTIIAIISISNLIISWYVLSIYSKMISQVKETINMLLESQAQLADTHTKIIDLLAKRNKMQFLGIHKPQSQGGGSVNVN